MFIFFALLASSAIAAPQSGHVPAPSSEYLANQSTTAPLRKFEGCWLQTTSSFAAEQNQKRVRTFIADWPGMSALIVWDTIYRGEDGDPKHPASVKTNLRMVTFQDIGFDIYYGDALSGRSILENRSPLTLHAEDERVSFSWHQTLDDSANMARYQFSLIGTDDLDETFILNGITNRRSWRRIECSGENQSVIR